MSVWRVRGCRSATCFVGGGELLTNARLGKVVRLVRSSWPSTRRHRRRHQSAEVAQSTRLARNPFGATNLKPLPLTLPQKLAQVDT